jgi:hypothetical protein
MYSLKSESIVLSPSVQSFLFDLVDRIDFDFVVTSGTRSARQQAQAMFKKIELGDDLIKIYKDDVFAQKIIDAYPSLSTATKIVEEYAASGGGSTHLRGLGVDIRTRNLTPEQIQKIVTVSKNLGASPLVETTPPHIHISVSKKKQSNSILLVLIAPLLYLMVKR